MLARLHFWEFLVAGIVFAAVLSLVGCGVPPLKTAQEYPRTQYAAPKADDRLERIEAAVSRLEAIAQSLGQDREAAIKNGECSERCEAQFGPWTEKEGQSRRDARARCYAECHIQFPMPKGLIGGGC